MYQNAVVSDCTAPQSAAALRIYYHHIPHLKHRRVGTQPPAPAPPRPDRQPLIVDPDAQPHRLAGGKRRLVSRIHHTHLVMA